MLLLCYDYSASVHKQLCLAVPLKAPSRHSSLVEIKRGRGVAEPGKGVGSL